MITKADAILNSRADGTIQTRLHVFYNGVEIERRDKLVLARFLKPHRLISTCQAAGGMREDIDVFFNHQSCEPTAHHLPLHDRIKQGWSAYRAEVCVRYGLDPERCAFMGTAANMRYACVAHERYKSLEVAAVCTGGVATNAGRVGEPASYYECDGCFEKTVDEPEPEQPGTINTMLFINRELTPGTLVRTIVTATEAKTSVLQELDIPSRYSEGLATGTGTDQVGAACMLDTGKPLTSAGKHSKLGELIGLTIRSAIRQTLKLQNGLTPESRRSAWLQMERLGATRAGIIEAVARHLEQDDAEVFCNNADCIDQDPLVAAAMAALVHLRDKLNWDILPQNCLPDIAAAYGAQLASAVSGKVDRFLVYMTRAVRITPSNLEAEAFIDFTCRMLAMGFAEKW